MVFAHIKHRLDCAPRKPLRSDFDLYNGPDAPQDRPKQHKKAAVLVPIVNRGDRPTILLTRRADHLSTHAGQVSFPGGRADKGDRDAVATALRETQEEIGIDAEAIDIVGRLDTYETMTGFRIVPVVGLVTPPFELYLQKSEVAEAFEVPLDFILDPNNHQRHSRMFLGTKRHFYAMPYEGFYIWGATAHMLVNLSQVLRRDDEQKDGL